MAITNTFFISPSDALLVMRLKNDRKKSEFKGKVFAIKNYA